MGDLNRCIYHLTKIEMTWRGAIVLVGFELTPVDRNAAAIQIIPWIIIKVKPMTLDQLLYSLETTSGHRNRIIFHLTRIGMAWEGAVIRFGLE